LSQLTRQKAAEAILDIFKTDQQAFKLFGASQTGLSLTGPEKTLIEKVIKQFAALGMQPAHTVASQVAQPVKID
jgi:hypothetical protein